MNNEKVYFTISVSKETAEQIRDYSNFLNKRNNFLQNKLPLVTDEDIIKGALYRFFELMDNFYGVGNFSYSKFPEKVHIKNRFREIAMKKGLDQASVSKLTGIESPNISRIFNNRNQPSMDYFIRIWLVLDRPQLEDVFYIDDE